MKKLFRKLFAPKTTRKARPRRLGVETLDQSITPPLFMV